MTHYLEKLFNPASIAVIGASNKTNSIGMIVFKNLLEGGYAGKLYPVNPKHDLVQGKECFSSIDKIKDSIDLVLIATPAHTVIDILLNCGAKGVGIAIVLSAGFKESGKEGGLLEEQIKNINSKYTMRILGPNCLGVVLPHFKINATFTNIQSLAGHTALVSQSGGVCVGVLDWAIEQKIGFSAMISLGNATDLDFGDILDYLSLDDKTHNILLYIESVHHVRRFISSLRVAARMKPVIVIKVGRHESGARAAFTHTGALIGADDVFDAVLDRAGAVRVKNIEQLFSATEILSKNYQITGEGLAIITNGGGVGVIAADYAIDANLSLPRLTRETVDNLNSFLPKYWSHDNPLDIMGDATPDRYLNSVEICMKDSTISGVLVILVPVIMSDPVETAKKIISIAKQTEKPILTCWLGGKSIRAAEKIFLKNAIPSFKSPEAAIDAFSYLIQHFRNRKLLLQVPESSVYQDKSDINQARNIINSVLEKKRHVLPLIESKAVLAAFGIPISKAIEANSPEQAVIAAESIGYPIAMKILSPDITHKQEGHGVRLNLANAEDIRKAYILMVMEAQKCSPSAKIIGVTIEPMLKGDNNRELMIGVLKDAMFGPVISFGAGGSLVEIIKDRVIAIPPLNKFIARRLISKTRVKKLLDPFRNMPAVNYSEIENVLLKVSEMVCELPEICEMDINPLIVNEYGATAVDVRIVVSHVQHSDHLYEHMAIHPYPSYLVSKFKLHDGTEVCIRPIRPEDADIEQDFVNNLSPESKYLRFNSTFKTISTEMLVRFTQIDYDREMALIAIITENGKEKNVGVARYAINPDQISCEFALVVSDDWQNKGIGSKLLSSLISVASSKMLVVIRGRIQANNHNMLELVRYLGFSLYPCVSESSMLIAEKNISKI